VNAAAGNARLEGQLNLCSPGKIQPLAPTYNARFALLNVTRRWPIETLRNEPMSDRFVFRLKFARTFSRSTAECRR